MSATLARPVNHIALSVEDVEAVTKWYSEVLGFQMIGGISTTKRSEDPDANIFAIYGEALEEVKLAFMMTGNGVGLEVFQFVTPAFKRNDVDFEYNRGGFFHICITDPDPDALAEEVVANGGSRQGTTVTTYGVHSFTALYVKDPWGNVVEILSIDFEKLVATVREGGT